MLKKVRYYIAHMKGPQPIIQNMSANEITFPKTDSMFYIGTAGSKQFGRGDTITNLHCSEYAYWPNPLDLMKGLLQAVPKSGEVVIESTGNGLNDYYMRCMRAYEGKSNWKLHFFDWQSFPEYSVEVSEAAAEDFLSKLDPDLEEDKLIGKLSVPQLLWRRIKLEEMNYDLTSFKQEYPMSLDECFQMSGHSIFHKVLYEATPNWQREGPHEWKLKNHPASGLHYVIGADVSGGVGLDRSVIEVVCLETSEQVAEYINDRVDPERFGDVCAEWGHRYNDAYVVPEVNNHGLLTVAILDEIYPPHLLHTDDKVSKDDLGMLMHLGHRTTTRTKPLMIGRLRSLLAHQLTIHSPALKSELSTFVETEDGKLEAQEGCFDDCVMALACAGMGINKGAFATATTDKVKYERWDPFSFESMVEELRGKRSEYGISSWRQLERWN